MSSFEMQEPGNCGCSQILITGSFILTREVRSFIMINTAMYFPQVRENTQETEHEAIDPDGEVQLAREVQSSVTQIEVCKFIYKLSLYGITYPKKVVFHTNEASSNF